jgi:glyoxylase-like metal-dependent hydrolase (beta-lactamase superfamily II)
MAEVKILIQGFTNEDSLADGGEEHTCPTMTLVRSENEVIVCDPGVIDKPEKIKNALNENGLSIDQVTTVFITHSHIDHYRNIGIFPRAKTLEYYGLWEGDTVADWNEQFTSEVKILKTPGHNATGLSLLVDIGEGKVAIVGDVFWKENKPDTDPYADNLPALEQSRKLICATADFIIPGHGPMYRVKGMDAG